MSSTARARRWNAEQVAQHAGDVGVWLAAAAFGLPVFVINGGFSVSGLGWLCRSFNEAGRLLWAGLEAFALPVPVVVPGLAGSLPIIPWVGVLASSICQIVVVWLKFSEREVPFRVLFAAGILSVYDVGTTFFGLSGVAWLRGGGWVVQMLVALFMTFCMEFIVGAVLPRLPTRRRRWRDDVDVDEE